MEAFEPTSALFTQVFCSGLLLDITAMHAIDLDFALYIPPGLASFSVVYVGVYLLTSRSPVVNEKSIATADHHNGDERPPGYSTGKSRRTITETMELFDGVTIILFRILRFLIIVALIALQVFDIASKDGLLTTLLQLVFLVSR